MTCVRGLICLSFLVVSTPSMPGMTRSMSATSGTSSAAKRSASSPDPASPTTVMSGCVARNVRTPQRTS